MPEEPILRIENIKKAFGQREVLKGVSLSISRGELKVLIGPSGAGKSTLLQCINFLVTPEAGEIWLEGHRINHHRKRELYAYRQQVGMIFQDFNLFDHLTALDNIRIALLRVRGMSKQEADARAMAELERVGLSGHAHHYPAQLSGGQKQRLTIARALARNPDVLLFDEALISLDVESASQIVRRLLDGPPGPTMLFFTHSPAALRGVDRFYVLDRGRVVESGTYEELVASGGILYSLVQAQDGAAASVARGETDEGRRRTGGHAGKV